MTVRMIPLYEKRQRGCQYCENVKETTRYDSIRTACPFEECPYRELDKHKSYESYLKSEDSKILVPEFFASVSGFYECPRRNSSSKRLYSDGMDKVDY